jgi:hypothetical protein
MPNSGILKGDLVLYKGVKYKVEFAGKTKFGFRAKLSYLNGTKEFWVNLSDLTPYSTPSKTAEVSGDSYTKTTTPVAPHVFQEILDKKKASLKTPVFDLGPPDPEKKEPPPAKPTPSKPVYATTQQIAAIKKLFPNRSYAVPLEKLSFVEADKMIRSRLVEM